MTNSQRHEERLPKEASPYGRPRTISVIIVSATWLIIGGLAIKAWGPLGLIVLIPYVVSLGMLYLWHVLCIFLFRRLRGPRPVMNAVMLAPAIAFACFGVAALWQQLPSSQFKRYVCSPMPASDPPSYVSSSATPSRPPR